MALKTNKSISLTGYSQIGGMNVIYMNATISTDGSGMAQPSITQTITDVATYVANKEECRRDLSDFTQKVYEIQDGVLVEDTKTTGGTTNESK